ncbi:serine hydrolase [Planococcus lenghuensis]|uniref:Serine hydrolase n=2 Tax=Planococcus lenghuensis TaxID=2213202 RepID=A0A1Q2L4G1_9BACL|nr:serine hydrolase [Planococcus lenghuensis]
MFKKVTLYTNKLKEMRGFYEYHLGFRVTEKDETGFTLAVGESELEFRESDRQAFYHYAINIPGNQFSLAKSWAEERVTLNRESGEDEIYYRGFDADAFYFEDPAGNIVEFIGRRRVDRLGDFTMESLLNISEINITTPFMEEVGSLLQASGIQIWGSNGIDPKSLNFLGQGDAFILLLPPKRIWYFSKAKGEVHPLMIELTDSRQIEVSEEGRVTVHTAVNPIHDRLEELDFSGVLSWMEEGETQVLAKGDANRADELPNSVDTRFGIASGSKIFTAVAICRLVEEGKLAFDDRLPELLPDLFPASDVTVHQLLTHTSGIPDYFSEEEMDDYGALWREIPMYRMEQPADFIPLFRDKQMQFTPGERFHYNNAGYIVLGLIAEKVTGQPFTSVIQKQVFDPAGMNRSGYFRLDELPEHTAQGYLDVAGGWRTNQYSIPVRGGADGGAFTTAEDMEKFWSSLLAYELLSADMTDRLLTPHIPTKNGAHGYGIRITEEGYSISGKDPGVRFYSIVRKSDHSILTMLANTECNLPAVIAVIKGETDSGD